MRKRIPPQTVEKIEQQTNLVEVVSDYVKLQPAGKSLKGLCPFHSERTPSFSVDPQKQLFHCFGCGEGGGVFNFLMKIENLTFPEAVAWAGRRVGIEVALAESKEGSSWQEYYEILELAQNFYLAQLREEPGAGARDYLAQRGFDPLIAVDFSLGFAFGGWESLVSYLKGQGVDLEKARELGLIVRGKQGGYYDYFRQRLLFPIADSRGRVIGFGGRVIDQGEPKYLNSPQSPLFDKSKQLYGLHLARHTIRQKKTAILVEGYMDVLALHQAGFTNAVASLGTALTTEQAQALARYAKRVILAYDADAAGEAAALRGMELLVGQGLDVRVASFPPGEDPDSFIKSAGEAAFAESLQQAQSFLDYQFKLALKGHDLDTPRGKAEAGKRVSAFLGELKNPIEREVYARQAAEILGLSPNSLLPKGSPNSRRKPPRKVAPKPQVTPAHLRAERQLLCLMQTKREIIDEVMHKLGGEAAFSLPAHREIARGLMESAAAGEDIGPKLELEPNPAITAGDCIQVILEQRAKDELSTLEANFRTNLAGKVELHKLTEATIKYKAFHDYLGTRLGRREG